MSETSGAVRSIVQNRVLASMAPESFDHLRPYLEPVALKRRAILQEHNRPIEHLYFIEHGVASLFARTQRDGPVEVAIVGRLGFVGVGAILGTMRSPNRCLMEVAGGALRIRAHEIRRIIEDCPAIQRQLLNYVHMLLIQNTQTALCNARHELDKRLCRWLLLASDRLDDTVIPLTHDNLSMILGVRRAGVTTTLSDLERAGATKRARGAIEIVDRSALERRACECYRIIASEYMRLTHLGSHQHLIELPAK
jgi:CRP-like cAMP-binding protein